MTRRHSDAGAAAVTVLGAAGEVTGSCLLVEAAGARVLLDCGLFQGDRASEARNRAHWPFDPQSLDAVVLSHAHLDHSGLLPRLVRAGFRGRLYATTATFDLLEVMLADSARLQAHAAERARRRGREQPPLYDQDDVDRTLALGRGVAYEASFEPAAGMRCVLRDAGHILGSASIELTTGSGAAARRIVFSGDVGQPGRPILRDPVRVRRADLLFLESTYGNREHRSLAATLDELVETVRDRVIGRGGLALVPAFAVGRTQELLYWFTQLIREGRLPPLDIHVDSPLANAVTRITARHFDLFDAEARALADGRAPQRPAPRLHFVETAEQSRALTEHGRGAIIIAASGMCEGGRIRHHLAAHLPDPRTTVIFTGFQARGTLGRALVDGAREVSLDRRRVAVEASIVTLGGFSAHADRAALLDWLSELEAPPGQLALVHGEPEARDGLAAAIAARYGWKTVLPRRGQRLVP